MSDISEERHKKSLKEIKKNQVSKKKRQEASAKLVNDIEKFIHEKSTELNVPSEEIINSILSNNFAIIEFNETTGKASLVYNWQSSGMGAVGEKEPTPEAMIKEFRDLRENFAPVAAGVEWHKSFSVGGGFVVHIDDIKDEHKSKMADEIRKFGAEVYQDSFLVGLDSILDVMVDIAITDGCDAAEIVYNKEVDFADYFKEFETVEVIEKGQKKKVNVPVFNEPDWNSLEKITRLKIIEDTYTRLRPYRHPLSGEVLYFTLDEKVDKENLYDFANINKREVIKFLPWEIFWLIWNPHGTNMKGMSQIKPVYQVAKFVKAIQTAVGVGFNRWANKKYFFVCGSDKRPWSKKHFEEFLKSMERMMKNNWVGIPVPAGFDVKDIGGEQSIFEGSGLLDFLMGNIASGMQYPRDFLESGKTQASDKSWLAWTVRYGRSQQILKRCIENQLFKRHLWCVFGKTYRISKKGVPVEQQKNVPIYIPRLMWKAEGQWLKDAKIKSLTTILNVANPADPVLKLAIEMELAQTIGVGELDWEATIDYFNTQTQSKLVEAKRSLITAKEQLELDQEMQKEGKVKELLKSKFEASLKQAKEPKPQVPQPQIPLTPEQKLQQQTEKRGVSGVSKTLRGQFTKKGQSKEVGGTRQPKRVSEAVEVELPIEETIVPVSEEEIKQIANNAANDALQKFKDSEFVKTEELKRKHLESEIKKNEAIIETEKEKKATASKIGKKVENKKE